MDEVKSGKHNGSGNGNGNTVPTPSFSLATLGSAYFSSLSPGRPSASTSGVAPAPCVSITGPPTRSASRRTACSALH